MGKFRAAANDLHPKALMGDYKSTLRDIIFLASSRQSRSPVQHQTVVSAIALDKIPPLSHLHSPRYLIGQRSLRQGQEYLFRLECAKRPSDARLGAEYRQIRSSSRLIKVGAGP